MGINFFSIENTVIFDKVHIKKEVEVKPKRIPQLLSLVQVDPWSSLSVKAKPIVEVVVISTCGQ